MSLRSPNRNPCRIRIVCTFSSIRREYYPSTCNCFISNIIPLLFITYLFNLNSIYLFVPSHSVVGKPADSKRASEGFGRAGRYLGTYNPHTLLLPRTASQGRELCLEQRSQPTSLPRKPEVHGLKPKVTLQIYRARTITTLFTGLHRPHTHSRGSSTFTEAQRTQPSPFDHRSQGHTSYMDGQDSTSLWLY